MYKSIEGNLLIAQAGGPTAVINASLKGVIEEAKKHSLIKGIYGARFGVEGVLNENFIDLGRQHESVIGKLPYTPASALGSCRRKLIKEDYSKIIDVLKKYNIRYFLYNGGNDSMDTCNKISEIAGNYDIRVIGIPKTIDNDLEHTDHCPGFGSAARYAAVSAMELSKDIQSLPIHVCIMELMGRNAGWITASVSLAKKNETDGPHLIYLPERPFIEEQFLEDVIHWRKKTPGVLIAVSEGLRDSNGNALADSGIVDGFGHKVPGGVAQYLSNLVMDKLGVKSRSEKPGLLGRVSMLTQSRIDREEAEIAGAFAVTSAINGKSGFMVSIKRISNEPYKSAMQLVPLEMVANIEKKVDDIFINEAGNGITEKFKEYCLPLTGCDLPDYVSLENIRVHV